MYSNQTVSLTPSFSKYMTSMDVISVVHLLFVSMLNLFVIRLLIFIIVFFRYSWSYSLFVCTISLLHVLQLPELEIMQVFVSYFHKLVNFDLPRELNLLNALGSNNGILKDCISH